MASGLDLSPSAHLGWTGFRWQQCPNSGGSKTQSVAQLRQKGVPLQPQAFYVHSDNAGGEVKNQTFMIALTLAKFKNCLRGLFVHFPMRNIVLPFLDNG